MSALVIVGENIVFGIPAEVKPIAIPAGEIVRLKFRARTWAKAFVRDGSVLTQHYVFVQPDVSWKLGTAVARNLRLAA